MEAPVLFVSHMPIDDPYGAAGALRQSISSILESFPDYSLQIVAPGGGGHFCSEFRSADVRLPMVMNFVGGLPVYQALPWNELTRLTIGLDWRRGRFDAYFDLVRGAAVVHVNSLSLSWLPDFTRARLGRRVPPFVCHVREMARPATYRRLKRDLAGFDGIICIDSSTREILNRTELLPPNALVQTVGDLVAETGTQETALSSSLREWAAGAPILGMAGRIDPVKGMAFVSSLMRPEDVPAWRLVIAGRASTHPLRRDSRHEFRRIEHVAKLFPERVRYIGEIPDLARSGFYQGIDLLVRGEPVPSAGLTVYEALEAGVPALVPGAATDFEGNNRIADGTPGLHFARPRDASAYRDAITRALSSPVAFTPDHDAARHRRRAHARALVSMQHAVIKTLEKGEADSPR